MTGKHRLHRDRRLTRLGRATARHPWRFVLAWILVTGSAFVVAVLGVGGDSLFSRLHSTGPSVAGEAQTAEDLLERAAPSAPTVMLQVTGVDLRSPQVATAAVAAVRSAMAIPGVASSVDPYVVPGGPSSAQASAFVGGGSLDSGRFLVVTTLNSGLGADRASVERRVVEVYADLGRALPQASTAIGSATLLVAEITDQIELDLRSGEGIALPLSFVLMVVVFGGFVAAGMPVVGAIASIGGALAALYGFSFVMDLDASVVNVVTLLGLGLCIDYGLLVVSRMREELRAIAQGRPAAELTDAEIAQALSATVGSAGRTVLFSGLTVAIALSGLLVFQAGIIRAIGAAGVSVVLIAMLVALTLVPALCKLGAHRILGKGTETAPAEGVFSRLARVVRRAPWLVIVGGTAVLVVLALPTLSMRMTSSGHQLMPIGSSQRDFFDGLAADYPQLAPPSARVVATTTVETATAWTHAVVDGIPGVSATSVRQLDPDHVAVSIRTAGPPLGDTARDLVARLRTDRPDFPTFVAGEAAALDDFTRSLARSAPYAVAAVVLGTFLLMYLMTGSVVLPTKALLLNVVSLGASLGIATWIFQNGHLEGVLGFTSVGGVEAMIPPLVLAFGFGLSMDYELFLISRIAELYHAGEPNDRAVEVGLQRSGRIITSAALLVVVVFSGFVAGKLLIIKETGLALAVAVLLDASIVRMLLVPATMTVLGRWNWWAPGPLRRWHTAHGVTE
ncbi:MAG: MMPL family transporter [Dermatophilaceae bacterium]